MCYKLGEFWRLQKKLPIFDWKEHVSYDVAFYYTIGEHILILEIKLKY